MIKMNEQLNNILKHYKIPVEQRGPLADDVFGVMLTEYSKHVLNPFNADFLEKFLIGKGFLREELGA